MEHTPDRPYIGYYQNKTAEVRAATSYAAQQKVAEVLRVPARRRYMITVMLADVVHSTTEL